MNNNEVREAYPAKYECTLCRKTHRLSQQQRDYGTNKYEMHWAWRVEGPEAIKR